MSIEQLRNFEVSGKEFEHICLGTMSQKDYVDAVTDYLIDSWCENKFGSAYKDVKRISKGGNEEARASLEIMQTEAKDALAARIAKEVTDTENRFIYNIGETKDICNLIEKAQRLKSDPCNPKPLFANTLYYSILNGLEEEYPDFAEDDLEYYTAVDTNLENVGIDAFFKVYFTDDKGEKKFVRVYFDLTKNEPAQKEAQAKDRQTSADVDVTIYMTGKNNFDLKRDGAELDLATESMLNAINKKIAENK